MPQPTPPARISYKCELVQLIATWKSKVQAVKPDVERHLDPALHGRLDIVEGDFEHSHLD